MPNIRKPNSLHKTNGTYRKDRHGDHGETLDDKDLGALPPPPTFLPPLAVTEWERVVAILEPYSLLKGTDYGVLLGYCQLFAMMADPSIEVKASLFTQFRGYCNDLGLTPISRSKLKTPTGTKVDDSNPYSEF